MRDRRDQPVPGRGCRRGLFLAALGLILVLTLFPYAPAPGPWPAAFEARFLWRPVNYLPDFLANILLFVPLGVAVVACRAPGRPRGWRFLVPRVLGAGVLSAGIEIFQVLLPARVPALADVLANQVGFLSGALWGESAARALCTGMSRIWRSLTPAALGALLVLHVVFVNLLLLAAFDSSSLGSWDPSFPLLVGNEATADRPWNGRVGNLRIWNRVVDPADPDADTAAGLLCRYDLAGPHDLTDDLGILPPLDWRGSSPPDTGAPELVLTDGRWLSSRLAGKALTGILRESGRFTISLRCATADTAQGGPGRIVSLSGDPHGRNFTLGQQGRDLVFRLRTPFTGPNGADPALTVPGVFGDEEWRILTVTYDGRTVEVRDGGGDVLGSLELRCAGALCRGPFRYREADGFGYRVVFWSLVWVPGVLLVGLFVVRKARPPAR